MNAAILKKHGQAVAGTAEGTEFECNHCKFGTDDREVYDAHIWLVHGMMEGKQKRKQQKKLKNTSSRYYHVCWYKRDQKWQGYITHEGTRR